MKRLWVLAVFLVGCAGPNVPLPEELELKKRKEETEKKPDKGVHAAGGSLTIYSETSKDRARSFSIQWKDAALDYGADMKSVGGSLSSVNGTLFENDRGASTYEAKKAVIPKGKTQLLIQGGIKLVSHSKDTSISCDQAFYDGDRGIVDCKGNVEVHIMGYVVKGLDAVRAYASLENMERIDVHSVGSPDMAAPSPRQSDQTKPGSR